MVNLFKVKKFVSLAILGFIPTFAFFIFLMFGWGIINAIIVWVCCVIMGMLIFTLLTRHPLMQLIQGEGMLALTLDSTGVIEPFIIKANPPFIKGKLGRKEVNSLFDRPTIFYMKNPKNANIDLESDDENFKVYRLKIPKGKESSITYAFQQYPTFIYNKNLGALMTKDSLAKMETEGIIKHLVLYMKVKTEELTSIMRDFARYVIEMTKPKTSFLAGKGRIIMIIIIVIVIIILIALFAPSIMKIISPALSSGQSAMGGAVSNLPGIIKPAT